MNKFFLLAAIPLLLTCGCVRAHAPAEIKPACPVVDWISIGYGGGGEIWACGIASGQPDRMYIGANLGGIYRSDNGGQSWRPIYAALRRDWASLRPRSFAVSRQNPDFGKDFGQSWKKRSDLSNVVAIVPSRRHPQLVCVANAFEKPPSGVFRTADDGKTWRDITGELPHLWITTMSEDPLAPNWLFVGTHGGGGFMAYDYLPLPSEGGH